MYKKHVFTIDNVFSICLRVSLNTTAGLDLITASMEIINDNSYNHVNDNESSDEKKREKVEKCPRVVILDWLKERR